jgi:signal transduction histidine kinase
MMPEMSGTELCRAIKGDTATRSIPVVLVTSKAEREMKIEGLEIGADDYVTKPFHPRELMARVRSLVRVTELQKQLQTRNTELEQALMEVKLAEVQLVQSERLAAVGELAAGIAHEVNNPVNFALNAVRTMEGTVVELRKLAEEVAAMDSSDPGALVRRVEAFQSKQEGETARELAEDLAELSSIVGDGLKRTSSLVSDLREFARPGRHSEMNEGVDIEAGVRSTIKLVSHSLENANAKIRLNVCPGIPKLFADPGALNQVFLNLIKNSAEAFEEGGGEIVVHLQHRAGEVMAEVRDDGPGIPVEVLPSLFEPFFTTKEGSGGTGLGLSISQGIVIAHGGRIEVESKLGEGALFRIFLPVERTAVETPVGSTPEVDESFRS